MTPFTFLLVCIAALVLIYLATSRNKQVLFYFSIWSAVISILAFSKVFMNNPVSFEFVMVGTVILTVLVLRGLRRSPVNMKYLLAIHVLRIPVELVLYQLYRKGQIPLTMTFKGINFDILMGISALILLLYLLISKKKINRVFFKVWNITGIAFLLFIVALAILSSPLPIQQFAFDQPNIAVLTFPYCLLPGCVVPIVFIAHLLLLRQK